MRTARSTRAARGLPRALAPFVIAALASAAGACADSPTAPAVSTPRSSASITASDYVVTELAPIGQARAINDAGDIVGEAGIGDVAGGPSHAVLWHRGVMTDLGTLGGTGSVATAISPTGVIAGSSATGTGETHAFVWRAGTMIDLGTLGGDRSEAVGVDAAGDVVGSSRTSGGDTHAFFWHGGVLTDLGTLGGTTSRALGITPAGDVLGTSTNASGQSHVVLWKRGVISDLGDFATPAAISPSGVIAGSRVDDLGFSHLVLWKNGTATVLPRVGSVHFGVKDINAAGDVVGFALLGSLAGERAFLWRGGVLAPLPSLDPAPGEERFGIAYGINNAGVVVGASTTHDQFFHAAVWTPRGK